ncbi:MAG TPA: hypothetical protein VNR61_07505 [Niallia sp.]|nr:hypothetical protein [Niallia sp.]
MKNIPHFSNTKKLSTKIKLIPLNGTQQTRNEFLKKIEISSAFNMKNQALFEYYGDDLIAYKKLAISDKKRNEFLRIFSSYLTDYLEGNIPSSWIECKTSFLEKLLFLFLPSKIKVTEDKDSISSFLVEFKKFAYWLDKKEQTNWVNHLISYKDQLAELSLCEELFLDFFLKMYPSYFQTDWNYSSDKKRLNQLLKECNTIDSGLFEIKNIEYNVITLLNLYTNKSYRLSYFPMLDNYAGLILHCTVGQQLNHRNWVLLKTFSVFPPQAKKYFTFI